MSNPTSNYAFQMPTSTDLVTDLPADFEVFGQAVDTQMKTNADAATQKATLTTTGDIYYASAANTPSRLGIGSSSQVLTVSGGVPTWATASGGALTLSTIASGTLSGTALNLTGLTQDFLQLRIAAPIWTTSNSYLRLRINNSSASTYDQVAVQQIGNSTYSRDYNNSTAYDSLLPTGNQSQLYTNANGFYVFNFYSCKNAGFTSYQAFSYCEQTSNISMISNNWGTYKTAAAVSSLYLFLNGGQSFNGGTYSLIGG